MDNIWELWRQRHQVSLDRIGMLSAIGTNWFLALASSHHQKHFQTRKEREEQYPPSYPDCYSPTHFADAPMKELQPYTNKDALSNKYTDNMYEYTERPNCSQTNMDCGSKYLFCHNVVTFYQCMAKLREGANCEGFEQTPICYEGTCQRGRCLRSVVENGPDSADFM
ncbi:unnamed protein product [Cylicostephanus goldi]|uniref:Uncharacterized protein n=1 Tax=Cylicostephanus goldi TaxID=71465 RepID=A0A3P6QTV1_CYLGO|nr:unnamed protein product [Cylicostephanus goldi]